MNALRYIAHRDQMEAAREEFSRVWPAARQSFLDLLPNGTSITEGLLAAAEHAAWDAWRAGKGMKPLE